MSSDVRAAGTASGAPDGDIDTVIVDAVFDMVIVGAGIVGVYQLYRAIEAGYSAAIIEAGGGVGGTWYWNRYPDARFDSESYTYAYLFSKELFDEWEWSEHFAAQPEIERYMNHVIDRFDLRRHIRFDTKVVAADFDGAAAQWQVRTDDGSMVRGRFLVAATGVLSLPFFPAVDGREDFEGESYHTGLWPTTPVDFVAKRVAVIGTGSSGVQLIPAIVGDVEALTVYQRTANWCTPLNNRPITPEEQAQLRADFESISHTLATSLSGFLHVPHDRATFDDSVEQRREFYEQMWASPGFTKLTSHYTDLLDNPVANDEWCAFLTEKIRSTVHDPETADILIPTHRYGQRRPPFVTGYYEVYNDPKVSLVDLRATPIERVTATGIETADGLDEFDMIVWATGFDFGTGTLNRLGVRGRDGVALADYWADGPTTYLGVACSGFPNFFFPGGPHGATGNNPRYAGDQVDYVMDVLAHMRRHGDVVAEVTAAAEEKWSRTMNEFADRLPFSEESYFFGANIPGKPVRVLLNPGGRWKLHQVMGASAADGYGAFEFTTQAQLSG